MDQTINQNRPENTNLPEVINSQSKGLSSVQKVAIFSSLGLVVVISALIVGINIGKNQAAKEFSLLVEKNLPNQPELVVQPTSVSEIISDTSPTSLPTKIVSPSPQPSTIPAGWISHLFSTLGLKIYAPLGWESDLQNFSQENSHLIRFWQGDTPDTATVQLTIKNDWSNMSGQYEPRNFKISETLFATKVDPPKMSERKLDRYQTNYYFETMGKVYFLGCVHNWIDANYQMCETLLQNMEFI